MTEDPAKEELFDCLESSLEALHCKHCDFKTFFTLCFKEHSKIHKPSHTVEEKYYCEKCNLNLCTYSEWQKHRVHCKHSCQFCDFHTTKRNNLRSHIFTKHTAHEKIKWYKCDQCPYNTRSLSAWARHYGGVHKGSGLFFCKLCSFTANSQNHLNQHVSLKHLPALLKWFHCDNCSFKTNEKCKLRRHQLKHKPPENIITNWFHCDQCQFKTKLLGFLRKHVSFNHKLPLKTNLFKCNKCSFKTNVEGLLKEHMDLRHAEAPKLKWNVVSVKVIHKQSSQKFGNS